MTHEPHARRLQLYETRIRRVPSEVPSGRRDETVTTSVVPESAAEAKCTVAIVCTVCPRVIIAVICGEHLSILVNKCIVADVTCINNNVCLSAVLYVYFTRMSA